MSAVAVAVRDITNEKEIAFYRSAFESDSVVDMDGMPMRVVEYEHSNSTRVRFVFMGITRR